jgi:hypothetical protein
LQKITIGGPGKMRVLRSGICPAAKEWNGDI